MNKANLIDVNENDFEEKVLNESLNKLVVVDFWAPWCGPCKQLTPLLEKIISSSPDKIILAKINIDENQQIASQFRIQSIPAVFAFKDKQVVNAFQGIITEKEIVKFLEEALGEGLSDTFDDFYEKMQLELSNKNYSLVKNELESFISENSQEIKAICLYLECLIILGDINVVNDYISSLSEEVIKNDELQKIIKRIALINKKKDGPSIDELNEELSKSPQNLEIVLKIADTYFADNNFNASLDILLKYYPKNKEEIKIKILSFFDVLGFKHESVIIYRKRLSSLMFS